MKGDLYFMKVKKFLFALAVLFILAGTAFADSRIEMIRWKCSTCGKEFYTFKGDYTLDDLTFRDKKHQSDTLFKLSNRNRNLDSCRHSQAHKFRRERDRSYRISELSRMLDKIVAVRYGDSLRANLIEWRCELCKKTFYSLGDNLNIKRSDRQHDKILSLESRHSIPRCSDRNNHNAHVFKKRRSDHARSWEIAGLLDDIYWVKD